MSETEFNRMPLIGDQAPSFKAVTTQGEINFPEDFSGKWVILFSHPADFNFRPCTFSARGYVCFQPPFLV